MLRKISEFIKENNMIAPQDSIIVGLSGGADSVCLLLVLKELREELNFKMCAVHVNHCIRGDESDGDEEFSKDLCGALHVPFEGVRADAADYAKQHKLSLEEAGRKLRYEIFSDCKQRKAASKIAVAHHMEDQSETVLLNLFRGSGLKGMGGMQPVREDIIRPLLCVRRGEIEAFLEEKGQAYRTDHTNFENGYTRNAIRNTIIPFMETNVNAGGVENICNLSGILRQCEAYISAQAAKAEQKCVVESGRDQFSIRLELFFELDNILKSYVIKSIIEKLAKKREDVYKTHIRSVMALEYKKPGSRADLAYGVRAERGYSEIILFAAGKECGEKKEIIPKDIFFERIPCEIPVQETVYTSEKGEIYIDTAEIGFIDVEKANNILKNKKIFGNDYTKIFDYDKIKDRLQFRTRQTGDYIQINKNGGTKKLKDYFIDEKVPVKHRGSVLLLADGHHILWVVGYRISEGYKISKETKNIIQIKF